jgi:transketolase
MRNAFAAAMVDLAAADPRVVLLVGDIGNKLFDPYKARFGDRFFNCGVAEASMIGIASGLAMSGYRPIAYTITPFLTMRCLEQIRVDLCYHAQPVTLVGVGAGLSYAGLGPTHHSLEDLACLRALPGMTVLAPADSVELRFALACAPSFGGPLYMRIGKKGEPVVHATPPTSFAIGRGIVLREGTDAAIIATGTVLPIALAAATELERAGVSTTVASFPTVKPLDGALLATLFDRHRVVATVEEHGIVGGFGSAVAEWVVDGPPRRARVVRTGTPDRFHDEAGGQGHARRKLGITPEIIAARVRERL